MKLHMTTVAPCPTRLLTKNVSVSLRIKCERMAAMTTEMEPIGVTRMATVKAYATKLRICSQPPLSV